MRRTLLFVVAASLAGCAQPARQHAEAPSLRAMGEAVSVDDAHSDEAIGRQIRDQFQADAPAETVGVTIRVDDGVVTLVGSAPTQAAAWRAEAVATAVKGVKKVINQIVITSRPSTPPS